MKNSIGVLVLTKNRRNLLERALNSLFLQTVLPDEIVIINDGSSDETKKYLDTISSDKIIIKIIHHPNSLGVNISRNEGLRNISSEWSAILDDDDEFYPNAIEIMKSKLDEVPSDYGSVFFNTFIERDNISYIGGYQFSGDEDFYDPSYSEVMIKFGLKGDCKPLYRSSLFRDGRYKFPESVDSFESFTQKKMAKDGHKTRYYKNVLTHIYLKGDVTHISNTASARKPEQFLRLHEEELLIHRDFYYQNVRFLSDKYVYMFKLSFRAGKWYSFLKYIFRAIYTRFGFVI